jgi:hypothetical protein
MRILRQAPSPERLAAAWVTAARTALSQVARGGRLGATARRVEIFGDNVAGYLDAKGQKSVSLTKFLDSGRRYVAAQAGRVAGADGRVSLADGAQLAGDLVADYYVLRGKAARPTAGAGGAAASGITTTLKGTWLLDLDTGRQGEGGDIWWAQDTAVLRRVVPSDGVSLHRIGAADFDALTRADLAALDYATKDIDGSNNSKNQLAAGTVIAVKTDRGHYSKILVERYGYDLAIRVVTFGTSGKPLALVPKLVEPVTPEAPPEALPETPPVVGRPVVVLAELAALSGGAAMRSANTQALGDSRWTAPRFQVDPSELARIEADPGLLAAFVFDLAFAADSGWIGEAANAPVSLTDGPADLAARIVGWDDWTTDTRQRIVDGASAAAREVFAAEFLARPSTRLRAMSWGDEDNTVNVAGLVAWDVATGEVRTLQAHHLW